MAWFRNLFGGRRYSTYNDDNHLQLPGGSAPNGGGASTSRAGSSVNAQNQTSELTSLLSFPREQMTLRGLFAFDRWKAMSYVHWFYTLGFCINGVVAFLMVANALLYANAGYAILSLVIAPLYFIVVTMLTRVLAESVLSVLMIPHLMAKQQQQQQQLFYHQNHHQGVPLASNQSGFCPETESMETGDAGGAEGPTAITGTGPSGYASSSSNRLNVRPDEEVRVASV